MLSLLASFVAALDVNKEDEDKARSTACVAGDPIIEGEDDKCINKSLLLEKSFLTVEDVFTRKDVGVEGVVEMDALDALDDLEEFNCLFNCLLDLVVVVELF